MSGCRRFPLSPDRRILAVLLLTPLAVPACRPPVEDSFTVVAGVRFHRDREAGVQLLDVDLKVADVRPVVVAENIERRRNNFIGDCKTVREWAEKYQAIGGINGGFFGDTYDQLGRRKQIVGLAVAEGKVIAPSDIVTSTRPPQQRFLRSVVGFTRAGLPEIAYGMGSLRGRVYRYRTGINPTGGALWNLRYGIGCGPRLFQGGTRRVADRDERLLSPGKLHRSFVAYDIGEDGFPYHLVLGRADAMDFADVADYLELHFRRVHSRPPQEAMCLDGGPSSQLVFRRGQTLEDAEPTGVLVPTALLLVPRQPAPAGG
ncbi:MAG: phosphodiester glycosidase family protein [Capsulimonadales bacterium]|nr:phosphodiester glycosidase family protein [Capsulimonadales bacterium]